VSARINFIPNDPAAVREMPLRALAMSPNRPSGRATFEFAPPAAAGRYAPGTDEFLFWQCREAALRAVATFERLAGPLRKWAPGARRRLRLLPAAGIELNAEYNRDGCAFYTYETNGRVTRAGASTDVVAHEVGHALLDAIRPDLWDIALPEHGAFHESFGDCMALLTVLSDAATRQAVLRKSPDLGRATFVESLMEDLSAGIRRALGATHPSSRPRRALNRYRWQAPTSLPTSGGPAVLTGEVHSFSRVFTGCFYDVIRGIFRTAAKGNAAALGAAADTAGRLLIQGARAAIEQLRFYRAVGEAMLQADLKTYKGANQQAIMDAFEGHGIPLASPARAFSVRSALTRAAPAGRGARGARGAVQLGTRRDAETEIKRQLGADPRQPVHRAPLPGVAPNAEKVVVRREVPLTGLSERLAGVVAIAPQPVVVSRQGRSTMVRSAIPTADVTDEESRFFVRTLLDRGSIAFDDDAKPSPPRAVRAARPRSARAAAARAATPTPSRSAITHAVRKQGTKRVLVRLRFTGAGAGRLPMRGR
jgi:hypothetical protein